MAFVENFPEGFFFIRCKAVEKAMDVNEGGMLNDYNIIIWPQKMVDSINQLWMHEDGFLINRKSGLVLDIRGGDIKKDKTIIQYARKPGLAQNQRWKYQEGYIFPASAPNLVLDVRGGELKDAASIFLNTKTPGSTTQQWLIQPFEDARSKQDLALLRPPPLQKHLTDFPQPEDLCDYHRQVYLEHSIDNNNNSTPFSGKQIAGAAAFEGIRRYLLEQKDRNQPIVTPQARDSIQQLVLQQVTELKRLFNNNDPDVLKTAEQAASSYFAREYEIIS